MRPVTTSVELAEAAYAESVLIVSVPATSPPVVFIMGPAVFAVFSVFQTGEVTR
jgi:hypothetical protein